MLIHGLAADDDGVAALVRFEETPSERRVWFRRERPAAGYEAFVAAFHLVAMQRGEQRVAVDGPLDPALAAGLRVAAGYAAHWWGWRPAAIEAGAWVATEGTGPAASFFSGGIDSMFTLHRNLRTYPEGHPFRIRRALLAYGFDASLGGDGYASDEERRVFDRLSGVLSDHLGRLGVALETVDTNARGDLRSRPFVTHFFSSVLAAMGHASGPGTYFLPSSYDIALLKPVGSHPDLDNAMGSTATRIVHDGHEVPRLRKLALMREWGADLSALHVCWRTPAKGPLNCGRCQKCRRTVFELVAVGADDLVAAAFPDADPGEIAATIAPKNEGDLELLGAAAAHCREDGRPALAVEAALRRHVAMTRRIEERDWRGPPKRLLRRLGIRR
ncbi:MAG: hypothetical protein ACWA6X_11970 [Bauldia sp.]